MIRVAIRIAVCAALGITSLGAGQQAQFRGGTHTVSLWATVLDREGRLVPGLHRDDFEVYDNGVLQPLTVFASETQPITIVMMLDRSGSMTRHYALVRDAAQAFVGRLLPDDLARIGSFSNRIQINPDGFTGDQAELTRILHTELQDAGPTPLWNATSAAMNALASQQGRRVILLFTDGQDTPGVGQNVSFESLRSRVQAEDIMVYGIGLAERCEATPKRPVWLGPGSGPRYQRTPGRGPGPGGLPPIGGRRPGPSPGPGFPPAPGSPLPQPVPREPLMVTTHACTDDAPDPELRQLTEVGGGGYFELDSTADLAATFTRVADELHQQYLLAFTPSRLDDTLHRLEVRIKPAGLSARSRRSYFAARDK